MKQFEVPAFYRSHIISKVKAQRKLADPRKKDFSPTELQLGNVTFVIARHFGFCYGVENAIEKTLLFFGKLDAIHNNAGIANPSKALHDTTDLEWEDLMNINLKSVFLNWRNSPCLFSICLNLDNQMTHPRVFLKN